MLIIWGFPMLKRIVREGFEHIREPLKRAIGELSSLKASDALPKAHPKLGQPSARYIYTDTEGRALVAVYRFDKSDNSSKKEFRPYTVATGEWKAPEKRPLYRLDLLARDIGPVVVVEGEKCADALNDIGVLATTCFGGCNGTGKADLSPLSGREVVIWPDNDEPGLKYAKAVALSLRENGAASIKIVDLNPETFPIDRIYRGWDAADAISEGWGQLRIRSLLREAIPYKGKASLKLKKSERRKIDLYGDDPLKLKEWGEPDMSVLNPRRPPPEFPVQLFGQFWGNWITAKAEGCSAPVDYVGMSLLSLSSSLIGCSRFVSPWKGWKEPPLLWVALVGNPSTGKSPALESVLGIVRKIEQEGAQGIKDKLRQHEADVLGAQCIRQDWERQVKEASKSGASIPIMPEGAQVPDKPERPRIFVSDATPEALARLLANQPKGLLVTRDELSGWLGSFNRYAGGQGGDRAFWLEAYGGRPYTIDRARNGGEAVTVPYLATSILGGIQPDKLHSLLLSGDDDGLTARFLFCWPDPVPLERPQRQAESFEAEKALRWLNGLRLTPDGQGGLSHDLVMLDDDAANFFQDWRKAHAAEQPEGQMASWWGKMPGVCLRLALCLEYLWLAATTRQETFAVTYAAVEAATVMIENYFKPMAARAYGDASLPKAERNAATLAKWIVKNKMERINTRELQRNARLPGLRNAAEIKEAIEVLEEANLLRYDPKREGETTGKMSGGYEVNPIQQTIRPKG
mgnify:CR=1 FL=1